MQKVVTFLWFEQKAEEAARYYVSVFGAGCEVSSSSPMSTEFSLFGQRFVALNGNREQAFNPSVSLYVDCRDQAEVDRYWDRLIRDGGKESQCGWLADKYGVSWQIIPAALPRLIGDKDRARAQRAIDAMLKMRKIDVAALERAADGT
jgi:predicted 3-demethylubiquinone-9 3-methyltransferase (glyoxalase superfamily)